MEPTFIITNLDAWKNFSFVVGRSLQAIESMDWNEKVSSLRSSFDEQNASFKAWREHPSNASHVANYRY